MIFIFIIMFLIPTVVLFCCFIVDVITQSLQHYNPQIPFPHPLYLTGCFVLLQRREAWKISRIFPVYFFSKQHHSKNCSIAFLGLNFQPQCNPFHCLTVACVAVNPYRRRLLRWPNTVFKCTGVRRRYLETMYFWTLIIGMV